MIADSTSVARTRSYTVFPEPVNTTRNEEAQQAASRNADSASSLSEFLPSVGVGLVCIVVYGYESAHVRFTFVGEFFHIMHTTHIVRIQADIGSITDHTPQQVASSDYSGCLHFLETHGEKLGGAPHGGGTFLVSHEVLLQFFLGCRTLHPTFQVEVFSLQESERQLVPPTSEKLPPHEAARYRVPRAS